MSHAKANTSWVGIVRGIRAALASLRRGEQNKTMRQVVVVLYVLALIAIVVGVDILFFKNHFWARLIVNVGIVLVFLAFGLRFLKRT